MPYEHNQISFFELWPRYMIVILFFVGLWMNLLKSHVILVFNRPIPTSDPFEKEGDLLRRIESGEYTAIVRSNFYVQEVFNPTQYAGKAAIYDRFIAAAKTNPTMNVSDSPGPSENGPVDW